MLWQCVWSHELEVTKTDDTQNREPEYGRRWNLAGCTMLSLLLCCEVLLDLLSWESCPWSWLVGRQNVCGTPPRHLVHNSAMVSSILHACDLSRKAARSADKFSAYRFKLYAIKVLNAADRDRLGVVRFSALVRKHVEVRGRCRLR